MSDMEKDRSPPHAGGSDDPQNPFEARRARPARFGNNKESVEYLEKRQDDIADQLNRKIDRNHEEVGSRIDNLTRQVEALVELHRHERGIPPGVPLNSASDFRAYSTIRPNPAPLNRSTQEQSVRQTRESPPEPRQREGTHDTFNSSDSPLTYSYK